MTKPNWAQKKVDAMMERWVNGKQEEGWSAPLVRLLKAERRRAVRKCQAQKQCGTAGLVHNDYNEACDDCARAVGGK